MNGGLIHMTKKMIGLVSCVIIIIATVLTLMAEKQDDEAKVINLDLYFFNDNYTSIVAENRDIKYDWAKNLPQIILDELKKGPADSKNKPLFSDDVVLLSVTEKNNDVVVDFSKEYIANDSPKAFLSTYAIVKSLCQLHDVERVCVTVDGEDIIASDGTIIGYMSDDDIDLISDTNTKDSKTLKLYFMDAETENLVLETRTIKITDTIPVEQYVVNELIKGPESPDSKNLLSSDTELISAQTTDSVCFVNFKSGFVEKNTGNGKNEELILYSIINSLCEIDSINSVQFLVDGKKVESFGNINIGDFFTMNEKIILN